MTEQDTSRGETQPYIQLDDAGPGAVDVRVVSQQVLRSHTHSSEMNAPIVVVGGDP